MRSSSSTSARGPRGILVEHRLDHLERHEALLLELLDQPDPLDELRRVVGHVARGLTTGRRRQQPLAQVVLDRAGADAAASASSLIFSRPFWAHAMKLPCASPAAPAAAPASISAAISSSRVAERRQHLARVLAERGARARPARPGVRDSLTGTPSSLTAVGARLVELAPPSRARARAPSRAPRRGRAPARGSSRARRRTRCHSSRVRSRKIRSTSACASEPGALELLLDQVLAPDPAAPRLPELRLERAERDPAVLARVGPVADERARPARARRAPAPALGEGSAPPPSPARTARRRPSTRPRAGPRRCARARAARRGSRTRPSARRRRGRRSGRPPAPAGRRRRRSARAARSGRGSSCRGPSGRVYGPSWP